MAADHRAVGSAETAPIAQEVLDRAERVVSSTTGIRAVAAVIRREPVRALPMHLSDLITSARPAAATPPDLLSCGAAAATEVRGDEAVSYGGDLPDDPDGPQTLPDALWRAAIEAADTTIVYICPDGSEALQTYSELLDEALRVLTGLRP